MAWLGISAWTLICLLMFFYGLTMRNYDIATLAVFIYAFGWVLRWWFGTSKQEQSPEVIYVRKK